MEHFEWPAQNRVRENGTISTVKNKWCEEEKKLNNNNKKKHTQKRNGEK